MSDRCETCDRDGAECPTLEVLVRATVTQSEARSVAVAAWRDCRAHAVNWRVRALAAEAIVATWHAFAVEMCGTAAGTAHTPEACQREATELADLLGKSWHETAVAERQRDAALAEVARLKAGAGLTVADDGHYKPTLADFKAARVAVSALPEPMWGYLASVCRVTNGGCWCGAHRHDVVCIVDSAPALPAKRCRCSHEAGDSACPVHPTCEECGDSTAGMAYCDACWARLTAGKDGTPEPEFNPCGHPRMDSLGRCFECDRAGKAR